MPELPEVEIVCRALRPVMERAVIARMVFNRENLRMAMPVELPSKLMGQVVRSIQRRGKYIICLADNGHGFVLHLGMSGVVRIEHNLGERVALKHDHVEIIMSDDVRIVLNDARRFGFLEAIHASNWHSYKAFAKMGVEPLGNDFNAPHLFALLKGRKTAIKQALLDQHIVAGIGNIYACEALFMASITPLKIAGELSLNECEALVRSIRAVLLKAIEAGGSSLKDYKHTDGKLGYFQHQFSVYDCAGQGCPDCEGGACGGVERIVQGGRSTFHCPTKQI